MPDRPTLVAEERTIIGKKVKQLRRDGKVPAIIYGTLLDAPIPVTLDAREIYRTYIDYGNISLVDVENGIVRVRLHGACSTCAATQVTLREGVARLLQQEIPEIRGVEQV